MQLTTPLNGFRKLRYVPGLPLMVTAAVGLNLAQWGYLAMRVHPQPDPIPLHYTIAFGIDRIGPWYGAYLLAASGTAILLANLVVSALLAEHQRASATLVLLISIFAELILLAGALLVFRPL